MNSAENRVGLLLAEPSIDSRCSIVRSLRLVRQQLRVTSSPHGRARRRLARLDATVFEEVRDAESQTLPAILVLVVSVVLSAIGGWLWLVIEFSGLSSGDILVKEVLLGSILALGLWGAWALVTQTVLLSVYGVEADRMALVRCMGFASAPAALMLLLLIPSLSFGIGLGSLVAWFVRTKYAIQAAAPSASSNHVVVANLAGLHGLRSGALDPRRDFRYGAGGVRTRREHRAVFRRGPPQCKVASVASRPCARRRAMLPLVAG